MLPDTRLNSVYVAINKEPYVHYTCQEMHIKHRILGFFFNKSFYANLFHLLWKSVAFFSSTTDWILFRKQQNTFETRSLASMFITGTLSDEVCFFFVSNFPFSSTFFRWLNKNLIFI